MSDEKGELYRLTKADLTWMKVALTVASRTEISEHAKEKPSVGCVIRRSRSKGPPAVLAVGWNGFPPKTPEGILKDKAAQYDGKGKKHDLTKELGLHAETNALRNCSENPEKATVYVTHVPCHGCAKQLVSHRVKRVFYLFWMDNSESSIELFKMFDISCIPFPDSGRNDVLRDFSESFLDDHNICAGSTRKDIPEKDSFHLSAEDSPSGTSSDRRRSVSDSDDYSLKILLEEQGVKVDKILHEFHEYRNQHNIKIVGVPEKSPVETALDTGSLCASLFKEIGANITIQDIDTAQRTAEGKDSDGPRPIICKFVSRLARDSVMACKVNPVNIGFSGGTDVSKISICDYDEDSREVTEGASSTQ